MRQVRMKFLIVLNPQRNLSSTVFHHALNSIADGTGELLDRSPAQLLDRGRIQRADPHCHARRKR